MVICIVLNAIAQATSSASLGLLVDNYILPMLGQTNPDFGPLMGFLLMLAGIYLVGIISAFLYNFLMVRVGQGTQKNIRDQMFTHMQTLPIRYFDTHPAGDVMSRYTSDIDTLRRCCPSPFPSALLPQPH